MSDLISREAAMDAVTYMPDRWRRVAVDAIRALPSAIAVKVKPLAWIGPCKPDGVANFYDHVFATSSLGVYQIDWKSWKEFGDFGVTCSGDFISSENSLESAKAAAQSDYEQRILAALDLPDAQKGEA